MPRTAALVANHIQLFEFFSIMWLTQSRRPFYILAKVRPMQGLVSEQPSPPTHSLHAYRMHTGPDYVNRMRGGAALGVHDVSHYLRMRHRPFFVWQTRKGLGLLLVKQGQRKSAGGKDDASSSAVQQGSC